MAEKEPLIDGPDVAFDRAKGLFGFNNQEAYPIRKTETETRVKTFPNFEVRGELWSNTETKLEVRVIPVGKREPVFSFSLEPIRGVTEVKPKHLMAIDIEEYSFPVQIPLVEIREEEEVQLASTLVDWLEKTLKTLK